MLRALAAALLCGLAAACVSSPSDTPLDHVLVEQGVSPGDAALLVVRLEDGKRWSSGGKRLNKRFVSASTAKIPHTLIALETGAVTGPDEVFQWDGTARFLDAWNRDQTFAEAFRYSTVWIYQIIVQRAGHEVLSDWLTRFGYGNGDTGGPDDVTTYWLTGPLEISAEEQVSFLTRLIQRDLPLSAATYEAALPMMRERAGGGAERYAKTGWMAPGSGMDIGWYVGWQTDTLGAMPGTFVFAFNLDMPAPQADLARRRAVVEKALEYIQSGTD